MVAYADTSGPLKDIHRRVGAAILFESSGGQGDKAAHLPELRFALGEPGIAQGLAVTYQALGGHADGQQPAWRVGHDGAMTEDEKR